MSISGHVESLDNVSGIARIEQRRIRRSALPGERGRDGSSSEAEYEIARTVAVHRANPSRTTPRCPHFGVCGGCSMQHAEASLQVAAKQRVLEEALERIGRVTPGRLLPPVHGPAWRYRHRARLSVRNVRKKGGVLVGFHERRSSFVADMLECHVVPRKISALRDGARWSRAVDSRPRAADRAAVAIDPHSPKAAAGDTSRYHCVGSRPCG